MNLMIWEHLSCILEGDLDYPEDLHNLHNYLLAHEGAKIGNVEKIIPDLNNKIKYVVHYENIFKIIRKPRFENYEDS